MAEQLEVPLAHSLKSLSLALCMLASPAFGAPGEDAAAIGAELSDAESTAFIERLRTRGADLGVESVRPSRVPGLYEVAVEGGFLYATGDGRFLIAGTLYEVRENGLVDLTEEALSGKRLKLVADIATEDTVTFGPASDVQAYVYVFTDTDCGFCRRVHSSMAEYNALGIEVRYLAYPRGGLNSSTYADMVSAWCADDPQAAMTALKRGEGVPAKTCANPVAAQFQLGRQVGLTGTPAFLFPNGRLVNGLLAPDRLAEMLGI